jgi:hypothetical protein
MTKNVLKGLRSVISENPRPGEGSFWENTLKYGNWFPWLWARSRLTNHTNQEGWNYYFNSFNNNPIELKLSKSQKVPPENMLSYYMYLACLDYTFTPNTKYNDSFNRYISMIKWPEFEKVLAIQIRRGEVTPSDGNFAWDRKFYTIEQYIAKADILLKENKELIYIYISTDSNDEIDKIKKLRPEWNLLYLPIDRTQFYRYKDDKDKSDLEKICAKEPNRIEFVVDSALADLFFISKSHGYISTITVSEFSRCGWYLQIAKQGYLTPYINMNNESIDLNKRDMLLLL